MKKILIVVALLCFVVVGAFAQSQQNQESAVPLTVLITEPYDGYTISIEYTEMLHQDGAFFYQKQGIYFNA